MVKYYQTKHGYYYKIYASGKRVRITQKEMIQKGGTIPPEPVSVFKNKLNKKEHIRQVVSTITQRTQLVQHQEKINTYLKNIAPAHANYTVQRNEEKKMMVNAQTKITQKIQKIEQLETQLDETFKQRNNAQCKLNSKECELEMVNQEVTDLKTRIDILVEATNLAPPPSVSLPYCTICMSEPAIYALPSCGHIIYCTSCMDRTLAHRQHDPSVFYTCPICRIPIPEISPFLKLFL
jgi:MarR-like DNA-binding transcriptional regulator SgrR of sgrS sRNA